MAVSVRFHREDPWERIRLRQRRDAEHAAGHDHHRDALHLLGAGRRGGDARSPSGWSSATGCAACRSPTRPTTPSALQRIAAMAKAEGMEEVVIGLTYSISEVHTHQYYAERRRRPGRLPGHGSSSTSRTPAACSPSTRCASSRPHLRQAAGERPLELHSHCTIGLAPHVYVEGVRAGFDTSCTPPSGPLARGTSQPEALSTARNLEAAGYAHRLDLERQERVAEHFAEIAAAKGLPAGAPARVRRRLLPPPAPRRDGHHHAADARRAAPARAVRRSAGGGDPGARRDGLSDHRHAGLAVHRQPGGAQRHRRRALGQRLRRDRPLLPRPLRRPARPGRSRRSPTRSWPARRRRSSRSSSRSPWRARARSSATASPRRTCCCA